MAPTQDQIESAQKLTKIYRDPDESMLAKEQKAITFLAARDAEKDRVIAELREQLDTQEAYRQREPERDAAKYGCMQREIDRLINHATEVYGHWKAAESSLAERTRERDEQRRLRADRDDMCVKLAYEADDLRGELAALRQLVAEEYVREALEAVDDLSDGSKHDWRKFAHVLARAYRAKTAALSKAKAFKTWTHAYLDNKDVPSVIQDEHLNAGCRIGGRMDWVFSKLKEAEASLKTRTEERDNYLEAVRLAEEKLTALWRRDNE